MVDEFGERYGDLLTGSYDCVDRIVLNAYSLGNNPGGFRVWWRRLHEDSDELLDNNHLMRFAGRFARRVRAWAQANGVPVIDCKSGERKHRIAEEYLATHAVVGPCVFLILVAKAPATVWDVRRNEAGVILNIAKKRTYVSHYSFHIMDPQWGRCCINGTHVPVAGSLPRPRHRLTLALRAVGPVPARARDRDQPARPAPPSRHGCGHRRRVVPHAGGPHPHHKESIMT